VTQRAVAAEYLTPAEADEWLGLLASAPFFAAMTLFVVVAGASTPYPIAAMKDRHDVPIPWPDECGMRLCGHG
jgi:hypothetical protein